jgi:hypothetical protein
VGVKAKGFSGNLAKLEWNWDGRVVAQITAIKKEFLTGGSAYRNLVCS